MNTIDLNEEDERYLSEVLNDDFSPNDHYAIYVSANGDPLDVKDVSSMFSTPEELDEIGFYSGRRTIIAFTQTGLEILEQSGFMPSEIGRDFEYENEDDY